ncbi:MAG: hypothetical protein J7M08_07435 [Planctomycetes bacterium]|nr:hypothetical protein [Planctomycetota bacterium]
MKWQVKVGLLAAVGLAICVSMAVAEPPAGPTSRMAVDMLLNSQAGKPALETVDGGVKLVYTTEADVAGLQKQVKGKVDGFRAIAAQVAVPGVPKPVSVSPILALMTAGKIEIATQDLDDGIALTLTSADKQAAQIIQKIVPAQLAAASTQPERPIIERKPPAGKTPATGAAPAVTGAPVAPGVKKMTPEQIEQMRKRIQQRMLVMRLLASDKVAIVVKQTDAGVTIAVSSKDEKLAKQIKENVPPMVADIQESAKKMAAMREKMGARKPPVSPKAE